MTGKFGAPGTGDTSPSRAPHEDFGTLKQLKQALDRHDIFPRKERGQNFLFHLPSLQRIAQSCPPEFKILEIGPGPGSLTFCLAPHQLASCHLVEKDGRFEALLREKLPPEATLIIGDALKISWEDLCPTPTLVLGNLPYNVSVPLLLKFLALGAGFPQAIFMFQQEVAQRIVALPNTPAYGRLSVMAQYITQVQLLFPVPRQYFWPCPRVDSTMVHFVRHEEGHPHRSLPFELMETLVAAAFGHRRKMLRKNLAPFCESHGIPCVETWLQHHGLQGTQRAEDLAPQDFCRLAQSVGQKV